MADLLFGGAPRETAILPPGTNRRALAQGKVNQSRYVRKAFDVATAAHKGLLGLRLDVENDANSPRLKLETHRNVLVIGGPVATDVTKAICGYTDAPAMDEKVLVPIPRKESVLPYYFYVGDENGYGYWNGEKRLVKRWLEDGTEKMVPLYGVMEGPSGIPFAPPLDGERVAGDMLMITRVPNPENPSGAIVLIGGLHGYSLESFFSDLEHNIDMFNQVLNPEQHDYFQALIPFSIGSDRKVKPAWAGIGPWQGKLARVDAAAFLASFPNVA